MHRPSIRFGAAVGHIIAGMIESVTAERVKNNIRTGRGQRTIFTEHGGAGTSRYMPHQGKQECARRVMQMARAAGKLTMKIATSG